MRKIPRVKHAYAALIHFRIHRRPIILFLFFLLFVLSLGIAYFSIDDQDRLYSSLSRKKWLSKVDSKSVKDMVYFSSYVLKKGDNIWDLAREWGVNADTLISINFPKEINASDFYKMPAGKTIYIPNVDGIIEKLKGEETYDRLADVYKIDKDKLIAFNIGLTYPKDTNENSKSFVFVPWRFFSLSRLADALGRMFFNPIPSYSRISSPFGIRIHPITKKRSFHKGVDLASPNGSTVYSALGGVVSHVGYDPGYGNYIMIRHKNGFYTRYAHLSKILVQDGSVVGLQTPIGKIGMTGRATGYHLHFEVIKNGIPLDPVMFTELKKKDNQALPSKEKG